MTKTTRLVLYLSLIAFGAFLAWGVQVVVTEPRDPAMGAP